MQVRWPKFPEGHRRAKASQKVKHKVVCLCFECESSEHLLFFVLFPWTFYFQSLWREDGGDWIQRRCWTDYSGHFGWHSIDLHVRRGLEAERAESSHDLHQGHAAGEWSLQPKHHQGLRQLTRSGLHQLARTVSCFPTVSCYPGSPLKSVQVHIMSVLGVSFVCFFCFFLLLFFYEEWP